MRETYHLVPRDLWWDVDDTTPYVALSLSRDGFIHCTDGLAELALTFDRHYGEDPRSFLALTIDLDALDVPWRFDLPGSPYPHIYGPIRRPAIGATSEVLRMPDGRFDGLRPVVVTG